MVLKLPVNGIKIKIWFENDVKMYGTQAGVRQETHCAGFENDVKMYGTQAIFFSKMTHHLFENDVKMYGTQAKPPR